MHKMEDVRVNKFIAGCGICSRREADRLIEQGRVTINGRQARAGDKVTSEDALAVNGKLVSQRPALVVLKYNKPPGVTCTEKDRHAEKTIRDVISYPVRVTYAGRLDKDSEGLLLLTNDGALIQAVMKGSHCHEKEYIVKVDKEITQEFLAGMESGVSLREPDLVTRPCKIWMKGKYTFHIILTQGINRQIRRMCQVFGYEVKSLKRIRVMNICLGDLRSGCYQEVTGEELRQLYKDAGITSIEDSVTVQQYNDREGRDRGWNRHTKKE